MSKRKGLSFEEKREKMLEVFTESAEFFTLKELEKIGPKRKGVISQSVKEVVESLRDDDLVYSDKCGVQTLFWCLPSDAVQKKRARLAKLEGSLASTSAEIDALRARRGELAHGREESEERAALLREIGVLEAEKAELGKRSAAFAECDPEVLKEIENGAEVALESANRWTDNVFTVKRWVETKFMIPGSEFFRQFEIPDDLDYLEG